ncbi:Guanine Nucleotide-Binding Protein G(I)/G(S)/G(O) Subunit Gamma-13 [Manis pentadactyla]|nr:Guanine Nucleotide-Binding Protein G(I)/G(S)/G(O) Subunit Gamma-13 [Manis pentadactyla]
MAGDVEAQGETASQPEPGTRFSKPLVGVRSFAKTEHKPGRALKPRTSVRGTQLAGIKPKGPPAAARNPSTYASARLTPLPGPKEAPPPRRRAACAPRPFRRLPGSGPTTEVGGSAVAAGLTSDCAAVAQSFWALPRLATAEAPDAMEEWDVPQMKKEVESLKHQLAFNREMSSKTIPELIKWIEDGIPKDPFLNPDLMKNNPWVEKGKCAIL